MIKPANENLTAYLNNSFAHTWTFERNVSLSTFYMQIKDKNGTVVLTPTVTSGTYDVAVTVDRTDLDTLTAGTYYFGLKEVTTPDTSEVPRIVGEFIIKSFPTELP